MAAEQAPSENSQAYQGPGFQGAGHKGPSPATQGGADVVDFQKMLEALQSKQDSQVEEFENKYKDIEGKYKDTKGILERVQKAFNPGSDGEDASDPTALKIAQLEQQLDHFLASSIEHEKQGKPIPLTTQLAISHFETQIANLKEKSSMMDQFKKMQATIEKLSNPNNIIDSQAYSAIDSQVINALDTIYGGGDEYKDQKRFQFDAITKQIGAEIRDLQKEEPELWDTIRRDQGRQAKMVKYFVERNIPPRAREILEEDQIKREPMGTNELWEAFREAQVEKNKALQADDRANVQYYGKLVSQIRQEILSRQAERMAKGNQR